MAMTRDEVLAALGDPAQIARELHEYAEDAESFSSQYGDILLKHPDRWVAFYHREVRTSAGSHEALLALIDNAGLPRDGTLIRFMDTDPPILIL